MNKQDKPEAIDKEDLKDLIGFDKLRKHSKKKWNVRYVAYTHSMNLN